MFVLSFNHSLLSSCLPVQCPTWITWHALFSPTTFTLMSASTTTETRTTPPGDRNKRGNRGRGRGGHRNGPNPNKAGRRNGDNKPTPTTDEVAPKEASEEASKSLATTANKDEDTTTPICWICAEPVKYYALSACNHRTCHVCALRLRALYKKLECTFCKVSSFSSSFPIFSSMPTGSDRSPNRPSSSPPRPTPTLRPTRPMRSPTRMPN